MLERVGLNAHHLLRYRTNSPAGGASASASRALIGEPKLVICDEPVSALDAVDPGAIVNLLRDLQRELSLSYLFVAHDLAVVKAISQRVLVMYLGRVMEFGTRHDVRRAAHPYTKALLDAAPTPGRARGVLAVRCCWRARCPRRSTRRPAARSARVARSQSTRARRTCCRKFGRGRPRVSHPAGVA